VRDRGPDSPRGRPKCSVVLLSLHVVDGSRKKLPNRSLMPAAAGTICALTWADAAAAAA
jgi:hypothetical protein